MKGAWYTVAFAGSPRQLRVELYIDDATQPHRNMETLKALEARRQAIESAFGGRVDFDEMPERRAKRVSVALSDADVSDVDRHDEFVSWILDAGSRFKKAIASVTPL